VLDGLLESNAVLRLREPMPRLRDLARPAPANVIVQRLANASSRDRLAER